AFRFVRYVLGAALDASLGFLLQGLTGRLFGFLTHGLGGFEQLPPLERICSQPPPGVREQEAGALDVAAREAGGGGYLLGGAGQLGFDRLHRQRREVDRLAAGSDRLEELGGFRGQQNQVDERRWLLERLEQRVLALVAHLLCGVDDEDSLLAFEGSVGGGTYDLFPHLLHHVLSTARLEPDEVGVR